MIHFSKSNEGTNSSTSWMAWGWEHFQQIFIFAFNILALLKRFSLNAIHYDYSSLIAYWLLTSPLVNSPVCFLIKLTKTGKHVCQAVYWARFWVQILFRHLRTLILSIQKQTWHAESTVSKLVSPDIGFACIITVGKSIRALHFWNLAFSTLFVGVYFVFVWCVRAAT